MVLENLEWSTTEMDLIKKVDERKEFGPLEDGYIYWWPCCNGAVSAWELRAIADELDRRNKDWNDQVMADFDRMKNEEEAERLKK